MSYPLLDWLAEIGSELTSTEFRVLFRLCHHTNKATGQCNPSIPRMATDTGMTTRTIYRALDVLEAEGYIETVHTFNGKGQQEANQYHILASADLHYPNGKTVHVGVTPVSPRGDTSVSGRVTPVSPKQGIGTRNLSQKALPSSKDFPMPAGVDPQHWADFLTNRKRKRMANTPTAHKRMLDDIARFEAKAGWTAPELIAHAAAKGWGGIYEPDGRNGSNGHGADGPGEPANPVIRAAIRREADRRTQGGRGGRSGDDDAVAGRGDGGRSEGDHPAF